MVNSHGKAALNFQISMILYQIALGIVIVIFVIGVAAANSERLADLADSSMSDEEQFSEILGVYTCDPFSLLPRLAILLSYRRSMGDHLDNPRGGASRQQRKIRRGISSQFHS